MPNYFQPVTTTFHDGSNSSAIPNKYSPEFSAIYRSGYHDGFAEAVNSIVVPGRVGAVTVIVDDDYSIVVPDESGRG
jgi:hypothetical protein